MKNPKLICFSCKHFDAITGCEAFEEIPDEILDGSNDHKKPLKDQENDIVFEPAKDGDK